MMFCLDLVLFVHFNFVAQKTPAIGPQVFSFFQQTVIGKNLILSPETRLACGPREPLFCKSGKSDFFCSEKFSMSLFRAIFAVENGREVATLVSVYSGINTFKQSSIHRVPSPCLRSDSTLASLPEARRSRK